MSIAAVFVEYLWPELSSSARDGVPLKTRYSHTRKRAIAVVALEAVLFIAPLFVVPPMEAPSPNARTVYVLNDDVYAHF